MGEGFSVGGGWGCYDGVGASVCVWSGFGSVEDAIVGLFGRFMIVYL